LYDLNETVSLEADVRNFMWGETTARIVIAPLDKTKANPAGLIVVAWHPSTPLSQQGIPAYWLKPGERVVVTGHPGRAGMKLDYSLLLKTITRPSDGWKWPDGPPPSAKPAAGSSSSNASGTAAATVSKPNAAAPPAQPPAAAAAAAPTAPKFSPPQATDSRGAAQAQIDKEVAAGTTALTDELRKKSQQALERARVETLCTQRAYKVSTDPTSAAHQQALTACRAENGQSGASAATAVAQLPAVTGTYVGTYQCAQGNTRLKVEIDQRSPPLLTALFTLYPASRIPDTNSDSFSYQLEGRYESSSDTRLTPIRWTSTPPSGYAMVGMVGRFEPQAGNFSGRIEGAGCSTFTLSRNPIKVAEFASVVSGPAAQSQAPRPASPQAPTAPPAGTPRPATPATPSTAARTTAAAPPKTLEFESSDFDALSKAVKAGAREVTVRGTLTRVTRMETDPGVAQKEMPGLYFEGNRVTVGPISHGLWEQIDAKFGKNGLAGKRVVVMSPAPGVSYDGRSILLGIHSADNVRVESK